MTKDQLLLKLKKLKVFSFKKQPVKNYKSLYEQDAKNCRLFSAMNELYVNTGLNSNISNVKNIYNEMGGDADIGGNIMVGGLFTSLQYNDIYEYEINPFKQQVEFVKLMKAGFAMRMARRHNPQIKADIKDNYIVETVLENKGGRHAVTIYRDGKHFVELGSRGDDTIYNNFKYTLTALLGSIKKGTIRAEFYFQFYSNDK